MRYLYVGDPLSDFMHLFEKVMDVFNHEMMFYGMIVKPIDFILFVGVANLLVDIIWMIIARGKPHE